MRIRLDGIDAPETRQTCGLPDGLEWDCASAATKRVENIVRDKEIDCIALETDRYGRIVATCIADGIDIGKRLVSEGLAWAFVRYSEVYVEEELAAREARTGIWQGESQPPWLYREDRWKRAAARSPHPGCPIKGNISVRNGERIYHTPWSPNYEQTDINEKKGERWFCDEAEAIAAGWRPAKPR